MKILIGNITVRKNSKRKLKPQALRRAKRRLQVLKTKIKMAYLVHPLPPRKVWVKKEYLYDLEKGHGELTPIYGSL